MKKLAYILLVLLSGCSLGWSQNKVGFDGQFSAFGNYGPDNDLDLLFAARYLPELDYAIPLDSFKTLDFEASANLYGSVAFQPFDTAHWDGNILPYRLWTRYSTKQLEVRLGLQKIDFGSATLLRPLQWFNQIDPRDPLRLTNGVYGGLGRYYFLNNANIWAWVLYGNGKTRGFDAVETYSKRPEFGGRFQYPVPKGEIALSYHHRTADASALFGSNTFEQIPEHRVGFDGKWDVKVGLWVEASYIHKTKFVGALTNQSLVAVGSDYTFGLGNGLNVMAEHLVMSFDERPLEFRQNLNITAATVTYPFGFYDNLSSVATYSWSTQDYALFLNYSHQFKKLTGYVMAYYNSGTQQGIQQNELVNTFSGPGVQLMLVYTH